MEAVPAGVGSGPAATGDGPPATSMSAGKRQRRGGGKQPPPLTEEEFATWERVPEKPTSAPGKPDPAPEKPAHTEHFQDRQGTRGALTESEIAREQQAVPRTQRTNDGMARVLKEGDNYTVIIRRRDDAGITVIRDKSRQEAKGFSDRYGWNPPFE